MAEQVAMKARVTASVLMPVGPVCEYVGSAVESILRQTYPDIELIIIDDCGHRALIESELKALGNDPRVRVIDSAGTGIADALNSGTAAATGQVWFRCDADDFYPAGRIAEQIEFLNTHPEFGAVAGSMSAMDPNGKFVAKLNRSNATGEITDELRAGATRSSLCSWAVRMELMREVGGFRRYFVTAEDIDMQLRLGERCRVFFEATSRYHYRLHQASTTHSQPSARLVFYDSIARDFQQQRATGQKDSLDLGHPPEPPAFTSDMPVIPRLQDVIIGAAWDQHRSGHRLRAVREGLRAIGYGPMKFSAWRNLLVLMIKPMPKSRVELKSPQ